MDSRHVILFLCAAITVTTAYSYGQQQQLTAPGLDYSNDEHTVELRPITYHKRFHFFAAPEEAEDFDEEIPEELLKKNINVVVIKAPENAKATKAIARLAKTLAEEKTAIYVLNKEPDLREISSQVERLKQQKTIRPEVHFIKYKTAEEADLAARNIQVEYDALKGPSEVEHQVTAALHSYVGLLESAGVQEMQLVSFYGRPVHAEAGLPQGLPASSFYLPPLGDSSVVDNVPIGFEGGSTTSYLPPVEDAEIQTVSTTEAPAPVSTTRAAFVGSAYNSAALTTKKYVASTAAPAFTTNKPDRGSYKYSFSLNIGSKSTRSTTVAPEVTTEADDLSPSNKYLPPSESKLRNKRLK